MSPADREIIRTMVKDLEEAYEIVRSTCPADEFESVMADISSEIVSLQHASKKPEGISFLAAGLYMLLPDESEPVDPTFDQQYKLMIKAAITWYLLGKENIESLTKL